MTVTWGMRWLAVVVALALVGPGAAPGAWML